MNLAETQSALKKGIVIVALLTFTYYFGRFLIVQGINLYQLINPPRLPDPEAAFGPLPQLKMTKIQIDGQVQYVLDTENGMLPRFPDRINVYPIVQPQPTLLSEQKIKQLAADLFFTGDSTKLTNSLFRWVDGANTRTFQADAVTKNFKLDTPLFKVSNVVANIPSITEEDAIESVEGFIRSKALIPTEELENVTYSVIPSQVTLGQIRETQAVSTNAKLMKVDATIEIPEQSTTRNSETKYKILGPNPRDSLISFTATNSPNNVFKYPLIDFTYWEPNYEEGSEYYLSPIQDVWNAIQAGNGITSYVKMSSGDYYVPIERITASRIEIRDIYLAYYTQPEFAPYLQPIYVFEGQVISNGETGEIVIYFPAVRGDFITQ